MLLLMPGHLPSSSRLSKRRDERTKTVSGDSPSLSPDSISLQLFSLGLAGSFLFDEIEGFFRELIVTGNDQQSLLIAFRSEPLLLKRLAYL